MIWLAFLIITALVGFLTSRVHRLQSELRDAQGTNGQAVALLAAQIEDLQAAQVQRAMRPRTHS